MRHWSKFIIGGTEVQDFSQFAYQLSLRYVEVHVCGASIIALHWALSAGKLYLSLYVELNQGDVLNNETIYRSLFREQCLPGHGKS